MSAVDRITEALTAVIWDTKRDHLTVAGTRDAIATDVLATVRDLIREQGPAGEQAREALGLSVETKARHRTEMRPCIRIVCVYGSDPDHDDEEHLIPTLWPDGTARRVVSEWEADQ